MKKAKWIKDDCGSYRIYKLEGVEYISIWWYQFKGSGFPYEVSGRNVEKHSFHSLKEAKAYALSCLSN